MPKKSSSKKVKEAQESPVAVEVTEKEKKSSSEVKKIGNEIDEIFSSKKRKKLESEKSGKTEKVNEDDTEKPKEVKKKSKLKKKKSKISEEDGFVEPPSRSRKRTNDGLAVYTAEELGIGKGDAGGTPLCPFDCSCCF